MFNAFSVSPLAILSWLVVWNMFYFSIQLGISSSQLTFTPWNFRGVGLNLNHQPVSDCYLAQLTRKTFTMVLFGSEDHPPESVTGMVPQSYPKKTSWNLWNSDGSCCCLFLKFPISKLYRHTCWKKATYVYILYTCNTYTIIYNHTQSYTIIYTIIYNHIYIYTIIYNHIQSYTIIYIYNQIQSYTIIYNYIYIHTHVHMHIYIYYTHTDIHSYRIRNLCIDMDSLTKGPCVSKWSKWIQTHDAEKKRVATDTATGWLKRYRVRWLEIMWMMLYFCIYIIYICIWYVYIYEPGPRTPTPPHPPPNGIPPPLLTPPPPQNLVFARYLHIYTYTHIYSPFHPSNLASLRYLQHLRATTSSTDLVYLYISIITFFSNRL